MSYKMPEVPGPKCACFSKIPRHPPLITKVYLIKTTFYILNINF